MSNTLKSFAVAMIPLFIGGVLHGLNAGPSPASGIAAGTPYLALVFYLAFAVLIVYALTRIGK